MLLLKVNFWSWRRFLVKYEKYDREGSQRTIALKITKYDGAGLQIAIGFGLQSTTKTLKIGLQMGLQWD